MRQLMRLLAAVCGLLSVLGNSWAIEPGELAPEVSGKSLRGETHYRLSDWRGRVVVVDFWASWCGPCVLSMPELEILRSRMIRDGLGDRFEVLGVNVDEDADKARRFLEQHPVSYPVISDLVGIAARSYEPRKLPSAYLVAPDGHIAFIYYGYGRGYGTDLELKVREVLNGAAR